MICYKDMTFCSRECANLRCTLNIEHTKNRPPEYAWLPIAVSDFKDCTEYKENDNTDRD